MGKKKIPTTPVKASGTKPERPPKAAEAGSASVPGPRAPFQRPVSFNFAGVGRNDICPCGSGKRFKNCHGH